MFERYTEKARKVIFFARYEASQFGSPSIETEHLLLGLLHEDMGLRDRFLTSGVFVEAIRKQVELRTIAREKVPHSVDLPLSPECKRVLSYGAEESERMNHKHIRPEHLLLGLLREEKSLAAEILHERGFRLSQVRAEIARPTRISMEVYLATNSRDGDYIDGEVHERSRNERNHGNVQTQFFVYFRNRREEWEIDVNPALRLQVAPTRVRIVDVCVFLKNLCDRPFLCVEVVSSEDRVVRMLDRVNDYLKMGVPNVWVADPQTKVAFQITPTEGWREVKDGVLRTLNPSFDVPLVEIFS